VLRRGEGLWLVANDWGSAIRYNGLGRYEDALVAAERATETARGLGPSIWLLAELAEGSAAERLYHEAIERLSRLRTCATLARAHLLYGEWLRREDRRVDAREQLRVAYAMLSDVGMEAFAERARRELLATGETVRKHTVETLDELTPQEARSRAWPPAARRTRRSGPSCSSARARSSGTWARCSESSGSAPAGSSARRCPTSARRPTAGERVPPMLSGD
jgi:hypothetical protein